MTIGKLLLVVMLASCRDSGYEYLNIRQNQVEDKVKMMTDQFDRFDACLTNRLDIMMRDTDIVVALRECLQAARTWR